VSLAHFLQRLKGNETNAFSNSVVQQIRYQRTFLSQGAGWAVVALDSLASSPSTVPLVALRPRHATGAKDCRGRRCWATCFRVRKWWRQWATWTFFLNGGLRRKHWYWMVLNWYVLICIDSWYVLAKLVNSSHTHIFTVGVDEITRSLDGVTKTIFANWLDTNLCKLLDAWLITQVGWVKLNRFIVGTSWL